MREDCKVVMAYINGTRLEDRIIRTDYDAGFTEGRQYSKGKNGFDTSTGWNTMAGGAVTA